MNRPLLIHYNGQISEVKEAQQNSGMGYLFDNEEEDDEDVDEQDDADREESELIEQIHLIDVVLGQVDDDWMIK